ncbi:RHS repeat-associated core domain-containing protein [uncultured Paludibaculum sp.]|uniref:RHS repeat-associated core domain-containing protein n=1 Tax=uncultured Paludibaculum sp. TaxID=1765020 RepID=UPI002AAB41D4|nr:RHS repeat-associated core domain-containing protein [uncultured Paludibaculum sp.]
MNGAAVASNLMTLAWNSGASQAPVVSPGAPRTLSLPNPAVLDGVVRDDGLPNNALTSAQSMVSGPAAMTFDNPNQAATTVSFTAAGTDELIDGSWATYWYGYDGEGHVRALTDAMGTVTDTYDYDAFGSVVGSTGTTPNAYRYRGEQWDADLGLYYLRARWYSPVTGRFLSRDPLDTGNRYAYAAADPVNGSDPSGLLTQWTIPAAGGEVLYAYTVKVIVYGSAAYSIYAVGHHTPAGRDFICILKSAVSAALAASELEQGYFGLAPDAYANGCRVRTCPRQSHLRLLLLPHYLAPSPNRSQLPHHSLRLPMAITRVIQEERASLSTGSGTPARTGKRSKTCLVVGLMRLT